jgi:hypothetical protein
MREIITYECFVYFTLFFPHHQVHAEIVEDAFPGSSLGIDMDLELSAATAEINVMEYDPSFVTDAILLEDECFNEIVK